MPLNYLDFDYSEDADGNGTLQSEIAAVLAWAHAHWPGACAPLEDGGAWHYDLHGVQEVQSPLTLSFDEAAGQLHTTTGSAAPPRTTLTLTLSGRSDFCTALREAFEVE